MTDVNSRVVRREVLYISEYAREQVPRPPHVLDGYIFNECRISGPGIVIPLENVLMNSCTFPGPEVIFPIEMPRNYHGFIVLKNCTFESCKFEGVGIAGDALFVEQFLANIGKPGS